MRLTLTAADMERLVEAGKANAGDAPQQVDAFCAHVAAITKEFPQAARYQPGVIL